MKKKTRKQIYEGYYKHITGKPVMKDERTKPLFEKSSQLEKVVQAQCFKWLAQRQILVRRNNVGFGSIGNDGRMYQYGIKDAADLICCLPGGLYCEIECKRGSGGTWSINQQKHAEKVKASGGLYYIVHGVDELEFYLKPILEKHYGTNTTD
jgi:hypothetical protein